MTYLNQVNTNDNEILEQQNLRRYMQALAEAILGQLVLNRLTTDVTRAKQDIVEQAERDAALYAAQIAHQHIKDKLDRLISKWEGLSVFLGQVYTQWQNQQQDNHIEQIDNEIGKVSDSMAIHIEQIATACTILTSRNTISESLNAFDTLSKLTSTTGDFVCEKLKIDNTEWAALSTKTLQECQEQQTVMSQSKHATVANTVAFIGYTALLTTGAIAVIATIGASVVASPLLAAVGTVGMMSVAVVGLLAFVAILGSMLCVGDENKDKKVNDPSLGNDVKKVPSAVLAQSNGLFALTQPKEKTQDDASEATVNYLNIKAA